MALDLYIHTQWVLQEGQVPEAAGGDLDSRPGCGIASCFITLGRSVFQVYIIKTRYMVNIRGVGGGAGRRKCTGDTW